MGIWSEHAPEFLGALAMATLLFYALPMLFVPMTWARLRGWPVAQQSLLAIYFARCVGGLNLAVVIVALRAILDGAPLAQMFNIVALFGAVMVVLHLVSGHRREYPSNGLPEAAIWAVVSGLSLLFHPS